MTFAGPEVRAIAAKRQAHSQATFHFFKRVVDLLLASFGLIFLLPILFVIAIAIKLDSRGPALFFQDRIGYRGRPFRIVKFRTMNVLENGDRIVQAGPKDGRVTRVGYWLRRTSLDELPQLINVIRGDMSLVGPRPHAIAHDKSFSRLIENYSLRHEVKPGITGWAQVNGLRGETRDVASMAARVSYDLWYIENCGLQIDALIFAKTILIVLSQTNAY